MTKYIVFVMLVLASMASADVPHLLSYQGRITDDSGVPLDGSHSLTFIIYDNSTGGTILWTETHDGVTVADGLFDVVLGSVKTIESSIFSSQPRWLGLSVDAGAELVPRTQIVAVAYAYRAEHADTSDYAHNGGGGGWIDDGSVVRLATGTDFIGIGTDAPEEKLHVNGDIRLNLGSDIVFGSDYTRLYGSSGDLLMTADDDIYLRPDDDIYIRRDGGSDWVHFDNSAERLGIGITSPQDKLHVNGDIRLNSSSSIAFGSDNSRLYSSTTDMIFTADDDIHLEPDDDIYVRKDGGSAWVHFDNSTERLGIGVTSPPYKLTVNGEIAIASGGVSKYHINYYQGGLNFAETGVQDRRIHIGDGGNVGIGTATPGAKLGVNGDLKVTGAYKGDISSSTKSDGAPFPRPAYDSGWFEFNTGMDYELNHNIGGDSSNYVIDLQFKHNGYMGIHNRGSGIDITPAIGIGAHWYGLTSSTITISPAPGSDLPYADYVRVRIWVIE